MIIYEHHSLNSFEAANDACLMDSGVLSAKVLSDPLISPNLVEFRAISVPDQYHFNYFSNKALLIEHQKCFQGDITKQTLGMFISRLRAQLEPYFDEIHIGSIQIKQISEFILHLQNQSIKPITIKQYLGLLKRILKIALEDGAIYKLPTFPKLKTKSIPRGSFSLIEYLALVRNSNKLANIEEEGPKVSHRLTSSGAYIKRESVPLEMRWLIRFMVNSFIRPVDIKLIKHKHIEVITGQNTYLRLNLPETKRHRGQVVTMRAAKGVYESLKKHQEARGFGGPNDHLFLPEAKDREGAIQLITTHFRKVLEKANLRTGQYGQLRTLYSLRHTAITFRLLYGNGIDLLTLARNARTSVEMIERFYSSNLTAEMNIEILQSKRSKANLIQLKIE
jgi:integrase